MEPETQTEETVEPVSAATQQWVWDRLVSDNQRSLLVHTMQMIRNQGLEDKPAPATREKRLRLETAAETEPET